MDSANAAVIYDDDDDDVNDIATTDAPVQLGFVEDLSGPLLHQLGDWNKWDGGKVGGKPIWLNPTHLPEPERLKCNGCGEQMIFLLQIYCPLDDVEAAFHRSLYLFTCRRPRCVENGSLKSFRCQLPQANDFYAYEPEEEEELRFPRPETCALCGAKPINAGCSKCRRAKYCSKHHQLLHWKAGHKTFCGSEEDTTVDDLASVPFGLFREMELVIEEEVVDEAPQENNAIVPASWSRAATSDDREDALLSQAELDQSGGTNLKDPQYLKFLTRIHGHQSSQVLRYAGFKSETKPLWMSCEHIPPSEAIPLCPYCNGVRKFEFQVMPQLLHFLNVDRRATVPQVSDVFQTFDVFGTGQRREGAGANKTGGETDDIDWGVLSVYTCSNSCVPPAPSAPDVMAYPEEFVWMQPPPVDPIGSADADLTPIQEVREGETKS